MNSRTASPADDAPRPAAGSPAQIVRQSGLPEPLAELVLAVTGKCRLWRSERAEVAKELCAHFLDGLEAGASETHLASSFGDAARAARLITPARKRLRPLWWRASRAALRALALTTAALVLLYALLAARFFLGSPTIARNPMNELNAPLAATPRESRGWPLYLEAKRRFGALPEFMQNTDPRRPGDEGWDLMVPWLERHQDALDVVRDAANRPVMGFVYSAVLDPDFGRAMEISNPGYRFDPVNEIHADNPLLVGLLLPHLGECRRHARLLAADASLAAQRGEPARFLGDVAALLGIAQQLSGEAFLISKLVGVAIAEVAFDAVLRHAAAPGLLSDAELRELAHRVAGFAGGRFRLDFAAEVLAVEDLLQRFYTDDGRGDGRFVGGQDLDAFYKDFGVVKPRGHAVLRAVQPLRSIVMPSRAQVMDLLRTFETTAAADEALPPWRHDERSADLLYLAVLKSGVEAPLPFLASLRPPGEQLQFAAAMAARDLAEASRSAALVVLALEAHRRARGDWPGSLADLVPTYLPAVPQDPFDGRPLRYLPAGPGGTCPTLYAVGPDGRDDGGRSPATPSGFADARRLTLLARFRATQAPAAPDAARLDAARGDWVIWPVTDPPPRQ